MILGIIGAMKIETENLIAKMDNVTQKNIAGLTFNSGTIDNVNCVVVVSGVGKVNAAMCTQILISEFDATHIINTGIAGAIKPELSPEDIVISTDLMQHDMNVGAYGYAVGIMPGMESSEFKADERLVNLAFSAAKEKNADHLVVKGRIVTGDEFVASAQRKTFLLDMFDAAATEMEGGAIGHVCQQNKLPFVVIRAISDKADGSASVDYDTFEVKAATRSAAIVIRMIRAL